MAGKDWTVLSVGGSLLNDGKPSLKMAKELSEIFRASKKNLAIVVGGGKEARLAAQAAREKYSSEFEADVAGIKITHKNAETLRKALGAGAGKKICLTFSQAKKASKTQKFVIMGGTIPGITTDADAALLAEALNSKTLINVSKTAIYDSNPQQNPNAKKFSHLTYEQLISLAVSSDKRKAGTNFIFDLLACNLVSRSQIKVHFINGLNHQDLKNALEGKPHDGTVVG